MKQWETGDPVAYDGASDGRISPSEVNAEAYLDPYALLQARRDETGAVTDLIYTEANRSACEDLELPYEMLIGSGLLDIKPGARDVGLFDMLVNVVETGEPLTLEDWEFPARFNSSGQTLYFDMSAVRVGDGIGLAWWDVTLRYARDRDAARAEREMSEMLDSLLDPHTSYRGIRDDAGNIVDLEYVRVNVAACRYLSRPRKDLLGKRLRDVWTHGAVDLIVKWGRRVLETGQPLSVDEFEIELPGIGLRRLDVRAVRVGEVVSFTWRDVTSRVDAAREIAQSREHYRLLAENASEMVFRSGQDGRIQWASPSVLRVLGWPPDYFVGKAMAEFIHPEDLPRLRQAMNEILREGGLIGQTELRMATSDGGWRWMSSLGRALVNDQGVVIGGVDAVRDIQAQKNAQIALEESEERFRRAMMDAAIGMAIVSASGEFERVNPAMSTLLGRDEPTLMASTWQELTHPEDLDIDLQLVQEVIDGTRETYRLTKRYLKPSGEIVWADLTVSGVRDEEGHLRHFVSQITDISDSVLARESLASSEEHYRLMAENSSDVVFRATAYGRVEWISPSVEEVLGWARERVIGEPMLDYLMSEDLPESLQLDPDNRDRLDFEGRCRTADGSYIWMDISSRPLLDESGAVVGRVGRLRDIQVEHAAREALRGSEQRFRAAMESAPTGMAVVDLRREFVQVNPALCRLLGRSEQWLLEHGLCDVMDPVDDDLDRRLRAQVLAGVDSAPVRDHQMIRSDGERVLVEQSIGLLRDERGRASGYVSQFVDVTEARAARDQLRFLATHDSMTELFNRHELVTRISGILSKRPRTGINVGVLFIDLDGLKPINDTYGHAVGDTVIVTVADRIRSRVRSADVLARFGGDEFVLVLPAIHTVANAERIAASLHEVVAAPMQIEGHSIVMTLSIGVALVCPGENADVALRQADAALYRAKRQGKACTVVYDPAWES